MNGHELKNPIKLKESSKKIDAPNNRW
jgi:hypothetical protein